MEEIGLCKLPWNIVNKVMKSQDVRGSNRLCKLLLSAIVPQLTRCQGLICEKDDRAPTEELCKVFAKQAPAATFEKLVWKH